MGSNFEIKEIFWRRAGFKLNIVKYTESSIEAKLALLSNERGISKSEFHNFIVSKCIVDPDKIGRFIVNSPENDEEVIIGEVINHIISVNPLLNPELLVVSAEGLIKIASKVETGATRLVDNARWNATPEEVVEDILNDLGFPGTIIDSSEEKNSVPCTIEDYDWEDAGLVFKLRKFEKEDISKLFEERASFTGYSSYKMYVMSKCIVDFNDTMIILDTMGITADISPSKLTDMIFGFCTEVNPFLALESIDKSVVTIKDIGNNPSNSSQKPPRRTRSSGPARRRQEKKAKLASEAKKKTFSDVSKGTLKALVTKLKRRVVGQDKAVNTLVDSIQIAHCGLRSPQKPIGAFMFTGQTGCGKTLLAKALSDELCGENTLIRVDCSEYSLGHEVSKLIGSPTGYIGYDDGGQLTNRVIQNPFSVVLFDEIEKAHHKFSDVLLQILDEGRLTDNKGNVADFSDCIIIMTSNLGVKNVEKIKKTIGFGSVSVVTDIKREKAIQSALKSRFKPEFLNRIDSIITFNSLCRDSVYKIVDLLFKEYNEYLKDKYIRITPTNTLKDKIYEYGFSKEYGARAISRTIEAMVIKKLAKKIINSEIKGEDLVRVDYVNNEVVFEKYTAASHRASIKGVSKNAEGK